jgi:hypothetical protein
MEDPARWREDPASRSEHPAPSMDDPGARRDDTISWREDPAPFREHPAGRRDDPGERREHPGASSEHPAGRKDSTMRRWQHPDQAPATLRSQRARSDSPAPAEEKRRLPAPRGAVLLSPWPPTESGRTAVPSTSAWPPVRPLHTMRLLIAIIAVGVVTCGCDPSLPPPKVGVKNWKPRSIGGPMEVRPLPPADRVVAEWEAWFESDLTQKSRVYEATLDGASNQFNFKVEVSRGETPMGRPEHTYVSFHYRDPTNGTYEFAWHRLGRHTGDYLRLKDRPRTVWVRLNSVANRPGIPLLQIEAFEEVEASGVTIAEPGRKPFTQK